MAKKLKEEAETFLFSLAYCSRATGSLSKADIDDIVAAARSKNAGEQITGWLVFGSGIFFQWLEGSREKVKRLMDSIIADPRHDTIVLLSESEEMRERLFGEWDMELVSADDIREVLIDAIGDSDNKKHIDMLRALVKELDSRQGKAGLMNLIDL